ncbi:MAG: hypothetical protein P4L49_16575 [Desulfosporosinus sp.]|nr:hypothetical protein [Desulfosporosinus sp.]
MAIHFEDKRKRPVLDIIKIPEELKTRPQWVLWKLETRKGKETKVPYQIDGKMAKSTMHRTWNSFQKVCETLKNQPKRYSGIGYVFSQDDPYVGLDIDGCIDEFGKISDGAKEIIYTLQSYTEISQSGEGIHNIVKGTKPGPRNKRKPYEMYDQGRYFCFTGAHLEGTPSTIQENQEGLNWVYERIFPTEKRQTTNESVPHGSLSDEDIINKARSAKNGSKFTDLYEGDWEKHFKSQSEADQSLCNLISFYTKDFDQIDRLFCTSQLYREKWDRDDYKTMTICKAIEFVKESYTGRQGEEASAQPVKKSQADILLELIEATGIELFHDSASATYIRFTVNGHIETWPTKAKTVKLWLSGQFYQGTGKAISPDALRQSLGVLEAKAKFEGPKIELSLRVADRDGAFWYDTANDDWQAIRIVPGSWEVVDKPLPLFSRAANLAAQVIPERVKGTEVFKVLDFVNLSDEGQKLLFIVELISCLIPNIPHAVSILHGEKGASKSSVMKIRRKLIDPAIQELQLMPKNTIELAILLSKNWMPSFDNLDGLSGTVSDILCVAATGGGISKRELFTDSDEIILNFRRCISLNGINEPATRPDLLDRAILFELERIPEVQRKSESELWHSFEEVRPRILGAMFQLLATAMQIYPSVQLDKLPRMADFAKWGYAIGEALYQGGGEKFLQAFEANRQTANDEALAGNPVASAIVALMNSKCEWKGTAGNLLVVLNQITYEVGIDVKAWSWPRSAKGLAKRLNQLRSNLIDAGIDLSESYDPHSKQKLYTLESSCSDIVPVEDNEDFLL